MDLLDGVIRSYDWGSPTALSDLRGVEPSGRPEAELWFGAHRSGPSTFRSDGRVATSEEVPFLVKVLAVDRPLSLQVHPDAEAAADPRRVLPDGRAKPEAVCAVGRFETLCGFRLESEAADLAASVSVPERVLAALRSGDWSAVVAEALAASPAEVAAVVAAARATGGPAADLVGRLAALHPGDPALLLVPMLRHLVLDDGDLLYVAPGMLHAHLSGLAVEVMASSDDVARAGLTAKSVDPSAVVGLLRPGLGDRVESATGPEHRYATAVDGVALWRLSGAGLEVEVGDGGPELLLCTDGSASVAPVAGGRDLVLGRGEAAWIGPLDGPVALRVDGTVHRVASRDSERSAR